MKKLIVCLFLFAACKTATNIKDPVGMYVCRFEQEFAKVDDTLLLQRLNNNYYKITRHTGVINKVNNKGKVITETWKLEFEADKNVFNELKFGKIIIWDEDKLIFTNRDYRKCCK